MDIKDNNIIRTGRLLFWIEKEPVIMEYLTTNLGKKSLKKNILINKLRMVKPSFGCVNWDIKTKKKNGKEKIPLLSFISALMDQKPIEDTGKLTVDRIKSLKKRA
jgi:hypothetical protein